MVLAKDAGYFCSLYNLKPASSSIEPPMFIVFADLCEHTDLDYHALPSMLRGDGN